MEEEDHFTQTLIPLLSHTLLHKASKIISGIRWVAVEVYFFGGIVGSQISY